MINKADIPKLGTQDAALLKSILDNLNQQDRQVINELTEKVSQRSEIIAMLTKGSSNGTPSNGLNGHHVSHKVEEAEEIEVEEAADIATAPDTTRPRGRKSSIVIPDKYSSEESMHIKSLFVLRHYGPILTAQQINDKIVKLDKLKKGASVPNLSAILSQQSKEGKTLVPHKNYDGKFTGYELREDLK